MNHPTEPAFPVTEHDSCGNPVRENYGMTKREFLIAGIIQGMCANPEIAKSCTKRDISRHAVEQADDLISLMKMEGKK